MKPERGVVYILSNPAYQKDIFKIGWSTRSADERARDLFGHTGVPERFTVEYEKLVVQPEFAEFQIHEALKDFRLTTSREFFRLQIETAVEVVDRVCDWLNTDASAFAPRAPARASPSRGPAPNQRLYRLEPSGRRCSYPGCDKEAGTQFRDGSTYCLDHYFTGLTKPKG